MGFTDRFQKTTEPRHRLGAMEADHYIYSAGIAGEKFFTALRDRGIILASHCKACAITYVPSRLFCERCFAELTDSDDREVGPEGEVATFTLVRQDSAGNALPEPEILAVIRFGHETTGFLHKLGEVSPEKVETGMKVEAVLKPQEEREARITDIAYFRPVKK
ncbi:MAG: Zn-ribbon domain-containing OB-fold protein [Armatimonadetes bacterium]|nr:Zn-ribbon domain-containing OB-fold protein [Armatimonadota bacterium]